MFVIDKSISSFNRWHWIHCVPSASVISKIIQNWSATTDFYAFTTDRIYLLGSELPFGSALAPSSCPGRLTCNHTVRFVTSDIAGWRTKLFHDVLLQPRSWTVRITVLADAKSPRTSQLSVPAFSVLKVTLVVAAIAAVRCAANTLNVKCSYAAWCIL